MGMFTIAFYATIITDGEERMHDKGWFRKNLNHPKGEET
jgi:hypothetical protein